ncbi:YqeG family HAD IIIA-type phosphatase [Gordonibacter sp. 28C]|uniref:YqeG family HAD IIIA-type phosphatase n=1 Tax=Gordonibacter sp. 28C TaxID=2078569 RepID=UPI000DF83461|nr:YqeG family HAD IIIA-type phosphatase [Gordonibacter sp. 28C]RDB62833.1 YqeG family HAD IIIA-type phosphatase [Gordonibacter sp. 28C]
MPLLEPDRYFSRLSHVDIERDLLALGFRFVLLDIDNTILSRDTHEVPRDAGHWLAKARDAGVSFCLVSNNWHESVYQLANRLSLPIVAKAVKPLPPAFLVALKKIGATRDATVVIGDQLVTDVLGAHFVGMKAYLLAPLVEQDLPHTLLLRNFERLVMGEREPEGASVPSACRPTEPVDCCAAKQVPSGAASLGTRSRGDAEGSRTEVRLAPAIPTISGTAGTLADVGGPVVEADLPAANIDEPASAEGTS